MIKVSLQFLCFVSMTLLLSVRAMEIYVSPSGVRRMIYKADMARRAALKAGTTGGLKQGQNLVFKANSTPMSNLWLSMIRHVGIKQKKVRGQ